MICLQEQFFGVELLNLRKISINARIFKACRCSISLWRLPTGSLDLHAPPLDIYKFLHTENRNGVTRYRLCYICWVAFGAKLLGAQLAAPHKLLGL